MDPDWPNKHYIRKFHTAFQDDLVIFESFYTSARMSLQSHRSIRDLRCFKLNINTTQSKNNCTARSRFPDQPRYYIYIYGPHICHIWTILQMAGKFFDNLSNVRIKLPAGGDVSSCFSGLCGQLVPNNKDTLFYIFTA